MMGLVWHLGAKVSKQKGEYQYSKKCDMRLREVKKQFVETPELPCEITIFVKL